MSLTTGQTSVTPLWRLPFGQPQLDPNRLAAAVAAEVAQEGLDFRTRLLIRDSLDALQDYWGNERFEFWFSNQVLRDRLKEIRDDAELGAPGFSGLRMRLMEETTRETILEFARELGAAVHHPTQVFMGGSCALILQGRLNRNTDDLDLVDEVPKEIRDQPALVDELFRQYSLRVSHFASHYLPDGWRNRTKSLGRFGQLDVLVLDPLDIFVAKLFSGRAKDRADLRALKPQLARADIEARVKSAAGRLMSEPQIKSHADKNWYILYGDQLPLP